MARELGIETIPERVIKKSRRSWRTNIETPYGDPAGYKVTSYRQECKRDVDGNLVEKLVDTTADPVEFGFVEVADRTFTRPNGSTFKGAQIAADISTVIDAMEERRTAEKAAQEAQEAAARAAQEEAARRAAQEAAAAEAANP